MIRKMSVISLIASVAIVGILTTNVRGWRALVIARLTRVQNHPVVVPGPSGFRPRAPAGFKVTEYAMGFQTPRWLAVAPDGDVFVSDSGVGQVVVLHDGPGGLVSREVFAEGLMLPFGIAFLDQYVYIANTNEVVRFRYDPATSKRLSNSEHVLDLPGVGSNGHWTRALAFSGNGSKLFVSVGSKSNVSIEADSRRAAVLAVDPSGSQMRIYASGLRNAVGIGINPQTGELWATVNERDDLGDDVPGDFFTHLSDGGFYGWPYSFLGTHVDNRVPSRPDLVASAIVPDVLLDAHVAPLQFVFYEGQLFPQVYRHGAFIAQHGSSNRRTRSGYDVVFLPFRDGRPAGHATPFLSGFMPSANGKEVYGRPVGLAVKPDGSLLISDDGGKLIWRVSYDADSR